MKILYILLGGKSEKLLDARSPVKFVTYNSNEVGGSESVPWSTDRQYLSPPISYLADQARWNDWRDAATRVLQQYNADSSWEARLKSGPQWFAQQNPSKFNGPDFNHVDNLIARELKHVAKQIIERKTVFVFPAKWPDNIVKAAADLVKLMVKELCAYFREAAVEQELPWAFLSMDTDSAGRDALGEFIRSLHSEMLADRNGVDVVAWGQKSGAILLSGPTGSGKSYAARLLAADTKLVEINLAAVNEEQLESRMRGYIPGTFTGADKKKRAGWFEEANGGILFLDEFQSVSQVSQVQLLDLLNAVSNDVQIAPIGADHERRRFNVKVILAINEDIDTLLREKRLRKDIYYRVRLIEAFPSLKERLDRDEGHRYLRSLLVSYRWKSLRTIEQLRRLERGWHDMVPTFFPMFTREALTELASQKWDGNFRELERVAFDLFYECDYRQQLPSIDSPRVMNVVKSWHVPLPGNTAGNTADGMTEVDLDMLKTIQKALRDSGFVIAKALKQQGYYKSRPPLKRYLRDHVEKLDADIRNDSRMIQFLGLIEN